MNWDWTLLIKKESDPLALRTRVGPWRAERASQTIPGDENKIVPLTRQWRSHFHLGWLSALISAGELSFWLVSHPRLFTNFEFQIWEISNIVSVDTIISNQEVINYKISCFQGLQLSFWLFLHPMYLKKKLNFKFEKFKHSVRWQKVFNYKVAQLLKIYNFYFDKLFIWHSGTNIIHKSYICLF